MENGKDWIALARKRLDEAEANGARTIGDFRQALAELAEQMLRGEDDDDPDER